MLIKTDYPRKNEEFGFLEVQMAPLPPSHISSSTGAVNVGRSSKILQIDNTEIASLFS